MSSQKKKKNNGDQRRAIYMYSRLLTGHPAKWIKNISNDFPCISFLQISRRSNDFFNEAKRSQKILLLILIVSTHIAYVFKI